MYKPGQVVKLVRADWFGEVGRLYEVGIWPGPTTGSRVALLHNGGLFSVQETNVELAPTEEQRKQAKTRQGREGWRVDVRQNGARKWKPIPLVFDSEDHADRVRKAVLSVE